MEADFLETVASVKSRLLLTEQNRPDDSQIGLIYKWDQLKDDMAWENEQADVAVGCTLDLFIRDPTQSQLIIKSTCYKTFTISVDLHESTEQLKARIEA